jgi:CubicO group peptidase (beta-lactamase class C family)
MLELQVTGLADERFAGVKAAFERNFAEQRELGASICVVHEGRTVVDLWAGAADADGVRPWQRETLVPVFSCTKAAVALCVHMLANTGQIELDSPVRRYWPEFAHHGKATITVRMVLNHQAGIPGLDSAPPAEAICDFEGMAQRVAGQTPLWRPGTRHGYHAMTFGWTLGEVVRRVTGDTVGEFLRRAVAEPLGVDFWIGLPGTEAHRLAETTIGPGAAGRVDSRFGAALRQGCPIQVAVMNSYGELREPAAINRPEIMSCEIPAVNGASNARGLARLFAPLAAGGALDGIRLVDDERIEEMTTVESAAAEDAVNFEPSRFSAGFEKSPYARGKGIAIPEAAFGHTGRGGSVAFADPRTHVAFGYAMNRHLNNEAATERAQMLIDAVYPALGLPAPGSSRHA